MGCPLFWKGKTMYKIGDVTIIDGEKRKVTGFCLVGGISYPTTEPAEGAVTVEETTEDEIRKELEEKIRAELEEKVRAEILAEMQGAPGRDETPEEEIETPEETSEKTAPEDEGKDPNLSKNLNCQYCGRECGSPVGLMSHEKACKMNPDNGGEK